MLVKGFYNCVFSVIGITVVCEVCFPWLFGTIHTRILSSLGWQHALATAMGRSIVKSALVCSVAAIGLNTTITLDGSSPTVLLGGQTLAKAVSKPWVFASSKTLSGNAATDSIRLTVLSSSYDLPHHHRLSYGCLLYHFQMSWPCFWCHYQTRTAARAPWV